MKMNEVMKITNLTKQSIIYYEKEGLIQASRSQNNYREYSKQDVQTLLWIKCMRSMQVSIEDIKKIHNNELSIDECLEKQTKILEENLRTLHQTKQIIDDFKQKDMPIIPELLALETAYDKKGLGIKKTSNNIAIGRPLTKTYAIKKIFYWVLYAVLLSLAIMAGWNKWATSYGHTPNFMTLFCILFSLFLVMYGFGLGDMGMYYTMHNPLVFMEFNQSGVSYNDANTFTKRIKMLYLTLQDKKQMKQKNYEEIESCKIICHHMLSRINGSIGTLSMSEYWDFYFQFKDGSHYELIRPIILENDIEAIKIILENKVQNYQYIIKKH